MQYGPSKLKNLFFPFLLTDSSEYADIKTNMHKCQKKKDEALKSTYGNYQQC